MSQVVTALGVFAATYIVFTLSATGWAKLSTIDISAAHLRAEAPFLRGASVSRLAVVALAVCEIGAAATAVVWPRSAIPAGAALALFTVFTTYNLLQALQGRNDAPCTCAGANASFATTALTRVVANAISIVIVALWAVTADSFPAMTSVLLGLACGVPVAVLLLRWSSRLPSVQRSASS